MKDDDPEKRIRELERELADARSAPPGPSYNAGYPNAGFTNAGFTNAGFAPRARRTRLLWLVVAVFGLSFLVPLVMAIFMVVSQLRNSPANVNGGGGVTSAPPITIEHGGTFSLGGSGANDTIACNDGSLTLNANDSTVNITGHCASLKLLGFDTRVNIDSADLIEVSGFSNTLTETACNDGELTFSGYGNTFTAAGHCSALTVSGNDNRVKVDGVDTIAVSSFSNRITVTGHGGSLTVSSVNAFENQVQFDTVDTIDVSSFNTTVTYRTGSPKITDSGRGNTVKQR